MRIYQEGKLVMFVEDNTFKGKGYVSVSPEFDEENNKIRFNKANTNEFIVELHISEIKKKNGTLHGTDLQAVIISLSDIINFSGGGSGSGGSATWGAITGTLSAQIDLQTALDAVQGVTAQVPIAANGQTLFMIPMPVGKTFLGFYVGLKEQLQGIDYTINTTTLELNWISTDFQLKTSMYLSIKYK